MADCKRLLVSSLSNLQDRGDILNKQGSLKHVSYGTAGFRGRADQVEHLFFRVGLITGLKCLYQMSNVGVMITASHNPIEDNGVKIIDSTGEMLDPEWEYIVEEFCNYKAQTVEELIRKLYSLMGLKEDYVVQTSSQNQVFVGYDTRPSSKKLVGLVQSGLDVWKTIKYTILGEVTTPAVHFVVARATLSHTKSSSVDEYYDKLLKGFVALFKDGDVEKRYYKKANLTIDCANGVGAHTMHSLYANDATPFKDHLPAKLINVSENDDDVLNYECGADYVKTKHLPPRGADEPGKRYASLDGDADRVVYFHLIQDSESCIELLLLDGDKILALYAKYLLDILKKYNLDECLQLGAIQTAYANGASTDYLKTELGLVNVDCVDTGVKHLHKKALSYDVGIYFEANGHGTIWISDKAKTVIETRQILELQRLLGILNNYTGDAISDILIVEMILNHYDWDVEQWDELYRDRPNSLIKVEVPDRNVVVTTNAGRTCLQPVGLQSEIDKTVDEFGLGSRCFVRASGTENVVRVYAESSSQDLADQLAQLVGEKVIRFCDR